MPVRPELVDTTTEVLVAMVRADMSRADLARRTGIAYGTLSKKLRSEVPFTTTDLQGIAQALGVPAATFLPERDSA